MNENHNPTKYIDRLAELGRQRDAIQEEAKEACIKLLRENPSGHFIDLWEEEQSGVEDEVDCVYVTDGNNNDITITSIGLDNDGHLVFRGFDAYYIKFYNGHWCRFDKKMKVYDEIYEFIVKYLDKAKTESKYPFYKYDSFELSYLD